MKILCLFWIQIICTLSVFASEDSCQQSHQHAVHHCSQEMKISENDRALISHLISQGHLRRNAVAQVKIETVLANASQCQNFVKKCLSSCEQETDQLASCETGEVAQLLQKRKVEAQSLAELAADTDDTDVATTDRSTGMHNAVYNPETDQVQVVKVQQRQQYGWKFKGGIDLNGDFNKGRGDEPSIGLMRTPTTNGFGAVLPLDKGSQIGIGVDKKGKGFYIGGKIKY